MVVEYYHVHHFIEIEIKLVGYITLTVVIAANWKGETPEKFIG